MKRVIMALAALASSAVYAATPNRTATENYVVNKIAAATNELKRVAHTGSYNDLTGKPTIPDISGKADRAEIAAATNALWIAHDRDIDRKLDAANRIVGVTGESYEVRPNDHATTGYFIRAEKSGDAWVGSGNTKTRCEFVRPTSGFYELEARAMMGAGYNVVANFSTDIGGWRAVAGKVPGQSGTKDLLQYYLIGGSSWTNVHQPETTNMVKVAADSDRLNGKTEEELLTPLQSALTNVSAALDAHEGDTDNPHGVTADQVGAYTKGAADARYASAAALNNVVQLLQGEDFRIVITNYDSVVNPPVCAFHARLSDGTNTEWRTVWCETNNLERLYGRVLRYLSENYLTTKKSDARYKAWGKYDSATGADAPDGFTQISSENGMIIASGAGFANFFTPSGGSYWIWRGNGEVSVAADGKLEIKDADGNAAITIVKGDKVPYGAMADGIRTATIGDHDVITIVYKLGNDQEPVNDAPTIEYSLFLRPANWSAIDAETTPSVQWVHDTTEPAAHTWTATVTAPREGIGFFRATYLKGGDSYTKMAGALSLQTIRIGDRNYTVGTATIDGRTVLTLQ